MLYKKKALHYSPILVAPQDVQEGGMTPLAARDALRIDAFSACINMGNFCKLWVVCVCVCVAVDAVFPGHNSNCWVTLKD